VTWSAGDPGVVAWMNAVDTQRAANATAVAALATDSGWVTAGFTIQTGFTLTLARYRLIAGDLVNVRIQATRTGGTITAGANGNISTDDPVIIVPAAIWPADVITAAFDSASLGAGGCQLSAAGVMTLRSFYPSQTIVNTNVVSANFSYMLG
jgi:hypothetical protein